MNSKYRESWKYPIYFTGTAVYEFRNSISPLHGQGWKPGQHKRAPERPDTVP